MSGIDNICRLPQELLVYALQYLDEPSLARMAFVNKLFAQITHYGSLWKRHLDQRDIFYWEDLDMKARLVDRLKEAHISTCFEARTYDLPLNRSDFQNNVFEDQVTIDQIKRRADLRRELRYSGTIPEEASIQGSDIIWVISANSYIHNQDQLIVNLLRQKSDLDLAEQAKILQWIIENRHEGIFWELDDKIDKVADSHLGAAVEKNFSEEAVLALIGKLEGNTTSRTIAQALRESRSEELIRQLAQKADSLDMDCLSDAFDKDFDLETIKVFVEKTARVTERLVETGFNREFPKDVLESLLERCVETTHFLLNRALKLKISEELLKKMALRGDKVYEKTIQIAIADRCSEELLTVFINNLKDELISPKCIKLARKAGYSEEIIKLLESRPSTVTVYTEEEIKQRVLEGDRPDGLAIAYAMHEGISEDLLLFFIEHGDNIGPGLLELAGEQKQYSAKVTEAIEKKIAKPAEQESQNKFDKEPDIETINWLGEQKLFSEESILDKDFSDEKPSKPKEPESRCILA